LRRQKPARRPGSTPFRPQLFQPTIKAINAFSKNLQREKKTLLTVLNGFELIIPDRAAAAENFSIR